MIRVGAFAFPQESTEVETRTIEAKSKVRKEVRIQSVIGRRWGLSVDEQLTEMQASLERFDRNEATLSIHPGRFYRGRQRHYQCHATPEADMAWIDLTFLTADRMERSERVHTCSVALEAGEAMVSLYQQGNWPSPARIVIACDERMEAFVLRNGDEEFRVAVELEAGDVLDIRGEDRSLFRNGERFLTDVQGAFPEVRPGVQPWIVGAEPGGAAGQVRIEYHDVWV